jgi:predicted metal-dependent hydrolase
MTYTSPMIPYALEYTKNRWSRAIYRDDVCVIRLARGLSAHEEKRHIDTLLKRMSKLKTRMLSKTEIQPFEELLTGAGEQVVHTDQQRSIRFRVAPTRTSTQTIRAQQSPDGWMIHLPTSIDQKIVHRMLWKLLAQTELDRITALIHQINDCTLRVRIRGVKLKFTATKWGSCSSTGIIQLNPALLFVPQSVLGYVIIHELAHVIHPNHSARFWKTVEGVMPEYAAARKVLRGYRLPGL